MKRLYAGLTLVGLFALSCALVFAWALWGSSDLVDRDRYWLAVVFGLGGVGGAGLVLVLWWLGHAVKVLNANLRYVAQLQRAKR